MIAQRDALLPARVTYASDAEMAAAIRTWNVRSPGAANGRRRRILTSASRGL